MELHEKTLFFFLLTLILISSSTLAQGLTETFMENWVGIIFILIFILILLWLGGVLRAPTAGGIPWGTIIFLGLIALAFIIPLFVEYPTYLEVPEDLKM